jgi:hypothetical protein
VQNREAIQSSDSEVGLGHLAELIGPAGMCATIQCAQNATRDSSLRAQAIEKNEIAVRLQNPAAFANYSLQNFVGQMVCHVRADRHVDRAIWHGQMGRVSEQGQASRKLLEKRLQLGCFQVQTDVTAIEAQVTPQSAGSATNIQHQGPGPVVGDSRGYLHVHLLRTRDGLNAVVNPPVRSDPVEKPQYHVGHV